MSGNDDLTPLDEAEALIDAKNVLNKGMKGLEARTDNLLAEVQRLAGLYTQKAPMFSDGQNAAMLARIEPRVTATAAKLRQAADQMQVVVPPPLPTGNDDLI